MNNVNAQSQSAPSSTLLFVDDEPNILAALQRLFRPLGYRILTATGGAAALEILAKEKVDLVISDMRMPQMDGAALLAETAQRWPQTVRILLTGYADLSSAVAAVNQGNIYRYLSKPWDDNDIKLTVQQALERKNLETQVQQQNEELKALNTSLENKVRARTEEVRQVLAQLEITHDELKKSFINSVRVFANMIELREGELSGHARRVVEHARLLARRLGMHDSDILNLQYAALLHDIGKIGLTDALLNKPFTKLQPEERKLVMHHPVAGQAALLAVDSLQDAAVLIRHHHEQVDGEGYPDRLKGDAIPLGARILAVVNDYDALQRGMILPDRHTPEQARAYLVAHKGGRYDARVVDQFLALLDAGGPAGLSVPEGRHTPDELKPGMVLSRDLVNAKGLLLLPRGRELNMTTIGKIREIARDEDMGLMIYVKAK